MNDEQADQLSKEDILLLEKICDAFERDLRRKRKSHETVDPNRFLQQTPAHLHSITRLELERIHAEYEQTEKTVANSTKQSRLDDQTLDRWSNSSEREPASVSLSRFDLQSRLGEGSTGVVWRAFDRKLKRQVALKIPHSQSPSAAKTYLKEAQAAARLDHPNIVRILEVGQEDGDCFLLAEFIDGEPLSKKTTPKLPSQDQVIAWMLQICDALEYAHQMGVVHRDLKPQNILVSKDGTIKIVDFGLAKSFLDCEATQTNSGTILGTPAYMSPEQAAGGDVAPKPTTDIYSLGVVFFQLLTGEIPFRGKPQSVIYQVLLSDPPSPRSLNGEIPVELETLCLKCMEKSPSERFPSAANLREELLRFCSGDPIHSRPLSNWRKLQKWVARNQRMAAMVAAVSFLLISIAVVSTVASIQIAKSWQRESQERERAEAEAKASRETLGFLESIFHGTDIANLSLTGSGQLSLGPPTIPALLDIATNRLRTELIDQPATQARLMDVIANAYRGSGELERCQMLLKESEKLYAQAANNQNSTQSLHDQRMHQFYSAWLEHDYSHWEVAERLYRETLEGWPSDLSRKDLVLDRADVLFQLGRLLVERNRGSEAVEVLNESLQVRLTHLPANSPQVQVSQAALAIAKFGPEGSIEELLSIFNDKAWTSEIVRGYLGYKIQLSQGNYDEASANYARVIQKLRSVFPDRHPILALALGEYAGLLYDGGNYRSALTIAQEVISIGDAICPGHAKFLDAKTKFANELLYASRFAEAAKLFQEVRAQQLAQGRFPEKALYGLVWCSFVAEDYERAVEYAKLLYENRESVSHEQQVWVTHTYATTLLKIGKTEESQSLETTAWESLKTLSPPQSPQLLDYLASIWSHHGDFETAEIWLRKALDIERANRPKLHPKIADRLSTLARILMRVQKYQEARDLTLESLSIREIRLPEGDVRTIEDRKRLENLREIEASSPSR